jgi:5-methylcytosine-specific restriction endonuclease McrA
VRAKKTPLSAEDQEQILARLRREAEIRLKGYRERALRMFPHVCASCGREFSGKRLKELTVHHKDHNHENNPPDGSNWELLCIYCHDHEHEKYKLKGHVDGTAPGENAAGPSLANPFANLDDLLKRDSTDRHSEQK